MWISIHIEIAQILSSRKTRIKTQPRLAALFQSTSAQILSSRKTRIKTLGPLYDPILKKNLRYYPPEKQGLRHKQHGCYTFLKPTQILSSRKTRIKTSLHPSKRTSMRASDTSLQKNKDLDCFECGATHTPHSLRYYPPEKQGLRHPRYTHFSHFFYSQILSSRKTRIKTAMDPSTTPF